MYACSGILEVGPNAIKYIIDCKDNVSISVTIYVLFGPGHTCYTFHTPFQVKKRPRLHRTSNAKDDESELVLLKDRRAIRMSALSRKRVTHLCVPSMKNCLLIVLRGFQVIFQVIRLSKPSTFERPNRRPEGGEWEPQIRFQKRREKVLIAPDAPQMASINTE